MVKGRIFVLFHIFMLLPQILCIGQYFQSMDPLDQISTKGENLQPCETCNILAKSFLKAVEETSRGAFAGGDALWEKNKLGNYADSELRFIEIQEQLCSEVKIGKDQCHNMAERQEKVLENWFYMNRKFHIDLLWYLCIDHLKICCPDNTYGPTCQPCTGGVHSPCNGHGICQGNGTREGTGICLCNLGYAGELCDQCQTGYYRSAGGSSLTCEVCDRACKDHCRGSGPKSCEICSEGFHHLPEQGCVEHFDDKAVQENLEETVNGEDARSPVFNFDSVKVQTSQHSEF